MNSELGTIDVAKEFGDTLYGRYAADGGFSGERFREDVLIPSLAEYKKVQLDFSKVVATPSSFFEEAFGGLIRKMANDSELASSLGIENSTAFDVETAADAISDRLDLFSPNKFVQMRLEKVRDYMKAALD